MEQKWRIQGSNASSFTVLLGGSLATFSLIPLRTFKGLSFENLNHYWVAVLAGIPNTFPPHLWMVENIQWLILWVGVNNAYSVKFCQFMTAFIMSLGFWDFLWKNSKIYPVMLLFRSIGQYDFDSDWYNCTCSSYQHNTESPFQLNNLYHLRFGWV